MRVRSDFKPEAVSITDYTPDNTLVEVYISENIKEVLIHDDDREDDEASEDRVQWDSDMYIFHLKRVNGLKENIEAHLSDWIATGRSLEISTDATEVRERDDEITDLYDTLADAAQSEYDTLMSELEG